MLTRGNVEKEKGALEKETSWSWSTTIEQDT